MGKFATVPPRGMISRSADLGAIVIGGDYRGLGIVRSLGRRGVPVWVLTDEHLIAATSRYTRRHLPWPATDEARQVDYLCALAARYALTCWALFPTGDEAAAMLARNYARLARQFRLTVPPWEVMRPSYDKRLTYQLAAELGIDFPWTYYPSSREDLAALDCDYPVILKPATKKRINKFTRAKAWRIDDHKTLLTRYDEACTLVGPQVVMVQELIPGGGENQLSYAALCIQGQPRASIVARRTRQHPIDFGRSSSYVETIEQPLIEGLARRLLAALRHTGLIEIEFKRDPRTDRYSLLDINPRVWGWHTLGERAGVDFSYMLWKLIQGDDVPEVRAQAGVRWIRAVTDLPAVAAEMRHGHLSPSAYLRSLRGPIVYSLLAADDPLPALVELPLLCYVGWQRFRSTRKTVH